MDNSKSCERFYNLQVNLEDIEKLIWKVQAEIYRASQILETSIAYKSQIVFLSNRDVFLAIVRNVVRNIKKKLICHPCTVASF